MGTDISQVNSGILNINYGGTGIGTYDFMFGYMTEHNLSVHDMIIMGMQYADQLGTINQKCNY